MCEVELYPAVSHQWSHRLFVLSYLQLPFHRISNIEDNIEIVNSAFCLLYFGHVVTATTNEANIDCKFSYASSVGRLILWNSNDGHQINKAFLNWTFNLPWNFSAVMISGRQNIAYAWRAMKMSAYHRPAQAIGFAHRRCVCGIRSH